MAVLRRFCAVFAISQTVHAACGLPSTVLPGRAPLQFTMGSVHAAKAKDGSMMATVRPTTAMDWAYLRITKIVYHRTESINSSLWARRDSSSGGGYAPGGNLISFSDARRACPVQSAGGEIRTLNGLLHVVLSHARLPLSPPQHFIRDAYTNSATYP